MTDLDRQGFIENGYCVLPSFSDPADLAELRRRAEAIVDTFDLVPRQRRSSALLPGGGGA